MAKVKEAEPGEQAHVPAWLDSLWEPAIERDGIRLRYYAEAQYWGAWVQADVTVNNIPLVFTSYMSVDHKHFAWRRNPQNRPSTISMPDGTELMIRDQSGGHFRPRHGSGLLGSAVAEAKRNIASMWQEFATTNKIVESFYRARVEHLRDGAAMRARAWRRLAEQSDAVITLANTVLAAEDIKVAFKQHAEALCRVEPGF